MEAGRDTDSGFKEAESARLKMNLQAFMTLGVDDAKGLELASQTITNALVDQGTNHWTALEMIASYDTLAKDRTPETVLYAYYSLLKKAIDTNPDVTIPKSLMTFIEQQATDLEEFSIVVEVGVLNLDALSTPERAHNPVAVFAEYVSQKRREFDAYVTSVTSDLYRAYSESIANFANFHGESYAMEKEIMDKYRDNPDRLRSAIAAGQVRTDQGTATARLQHDCEMISRHSGSLIDQKSDMDQRLLLTEKGKMALTAQFEYGLINQGAEQPEKYKGLHRKDLRTQAAKSLAAALYDKYLFDSANGDVAAIYNDLNNYRYLSKQGKESAKRIVSE